MNAFDPSPPNSGDIAVGTVNKGSISLACDLKRLSGTEHYGQPLGGNRAREVLGLLSPPHESRYNTIS